MPSRFRVSDRLAGVQPPVIPIVADLIRAHPGTISLGQGTVSFGPPPQAVARLERSLGDPDSYRYGDDAGLSELIEALAAKVARENGITDRTASRIMVTAGSNMAFLHVVLAVADPGDEIVLLAPYYFNHEMAVGMAGCRARVVATDDRDQPRLDAIDAAITPRTRAIVTVSPNNPSGAVYSEAALGAISERTPLDAMTVTERLIHEHRVAVLPGTAFGMAEGCYLRIAYGALDRGSAGEGAGRLVKGLRGIAGGRP